MSQTYSREEAQKLTHCPVCRAAMFRFRQVKRGDDSRWHCDECYEEECEVEAMKDLERKKDQRRMEKEDRGW